MAIHNEIGKIGEEIASNYLITQLNFVLVDKNVRVGRAEIDLVAIDKHGNYHIIEVKTRTDTKFNPEEAVDDKKLKLLFDAMNIYKESNQLETEFFIDILTIRNVQKSPIIDYFQDVYYGQNY